MIQPKQIFDMALSATGREARATFDQETESPAQYCRHRDRIADRPQLERAWRFAQLLDLERCTEAMRQRDATREQRERMATGQTDNG